ncbi:uncharacterized protein [Haliotis asinina]|uniref:uncharacterized protein n=1 Tax=Haliotis asinina TaxID=109174 RepID=UPI0035326EA3
MRRLREDERLRGIGMLQAERTQAYTAVQLGVSQSLVSRLWARYQATGRVARRVPPDGTTAGSSPEPIAIVDKMRHRLYFACILAAFTDTCICQKDFWKTDQSAETDTCSATQTYITCLKGKTALACDGSTSVAALASAVETRLKALDNPSCNVTTACQCEIDAAKANISTDALKCTAYNTELSCLRTAKSAGCDGTSTKRSIAMAAETARNALATTDCPAASSTCLCEITAAKGDTSTDANYCNVLTSLRSCLSAITTTTEGGCTTLTQADLLNDTNTKITAATCGGEHVTFAVMSLIVSVVASMFL